MRYICVWLFQFSLLRTQVRGDFNFQGTKYFFHQKSKRGSPVWNTYHAEMGASYSFWDRKLIFFHSFQGGTKGKMLEKQCIVLAIFHIWESCSPLSHLQKFVFFLIFLEQICPKWIKLDLIWFLRKKNVNIKSCHILDQICPK